MTLEVSDGAEMAVLVAT